MRKSNAKKNKEPIWKIRILTDISRFRKDLSRIEAWFVERWKNDKKKEKDWLDQKKRLRRKGFTLTMEELKQRITTKATKVKRYEWIDKAKEKMPSEKKNAVKITKNDVKRKLKPMPDQKGARPDKIQGFWLKSFTAVHEALATVLNECVEVEDVPGWLVG